MKIAKRCIKRTKNVQISLKCFVSKQGKALISFAQCVISAFISAASIYLNMKNIFLQ